MMKHQQFIRSLGDALRGIFSALGREKNMRLHFISTAAALAASLYFKVGKFELLFVLTAITLVWITEMLNTAIEAAIDLKTTASHPLARLAKNVAAGAVLCAAIFALIVGIIVFAGRLKNLP